MTLSLTLTTTPLDANPMMLTFNVKITEGMIYDAIVGAVKECLPALTRQVAGTGNLRASSAFTIMRNGKPITPEKLAVVRDNPLKASVKYSVVVTVGGVTVTLGI